MRESRRSRAGRKEPALSISWSLRPRRMRRARAIWPNVMPSRPSARCSVRLGMPISAAAALAALSAMTTLTGSAILALATARGILSPAEAWRLAHLDEDYQNKLLGVDDEARARRDARWR